MLVVGCWTFRNLVIRLVAQRGHIPGDKADRHPVAALADNLVGNRFAGGVHDAKGLPGIRKRACRG